MRAAIKTVFTHIAEHRTAMEFERVVAYEKVLNTAYDGSTIRFNLSISESVVTICSHTAFGEASESFFFSMEEILLIKEQLYQELELPCLGGQVFANDEVTVRTSHLPNGKTESSNDFVGPCYKSYVLIGRNRGELSNEIRLELAKACPLLDALEAVHCIFELLQKPAVDLFDRVMAIDYMRGMASWEAFSAGYGQGWSEDDISFALYDIYDLENTYWIDKFRRVCHVFGFPESMILRMDSCGVATAIRVAIQQRIFEEVSARQFICRILDDCSND